MTSTVASCNMSTLFAYLICLRALLGLLLFGLDLGLHRYFGFIRRWRLFLAVRNFGVETCDLTFIYNVSSFCSSIPALL